MCRASCFWPAFASLPEVPGVPGVRSVHGMWITEEEYRVTGWHSRGTYPTDKGTTEHIWIAPVSGHMAWDKIERDRREVRIAAAQNRRAADDEYSRSLGGE